MQNTASFSVKSQNLGSIAADKPSSFLRKQESRCWFDWIPACAGMTGECKNDKVLWIDYVSFPRRSVGTRKKYPPSAGG